MTQQSRSKNAAKGAALVTGASMRIGKAVALSLADRGYAIAIHHRNSQGAALAVQNEIKESGGEATILHGDLADAAVATSLVGTASDALGQPISVLVNNASLFNADEIETVSPDGWDAHMDVNLKAPVLLAQSMFSALPKQQRGNIINFIDQRVLKLNPQFFSYTLSKSGLWTATRTMAQAMAPRVRVNAIGPGPTLENNHQKPGDFEKESANVPLGHGPSLNEITDAIHFILETSSMTGQMVTLDGGQHLAWRTDDII